ncbi:hypothetical protein F4782DRAFT_516029 [Xylaria castorea]|nr:hypothetical protein F4782DRAFT_516029 [Xylaria castorea]
MKPLPASAVVLTFASIVLSDQNRDPTQTAENPQAVDAVKADAPSHETTITAADSQICPSCAELSSSESNVTSANSTNIDVEIKKGGGRGFGKGWKGGAGHSGASRIDSHSVALVSATCCLCGIIANLT